VELSAFPLNIKTLQAIARMTIGFSGVSWPGGFYYRVSTHGNLSYDDRVSDAETASPKGRVGCFCIAPLPKHKTAHLNDRQGRSYLLKQAVSLVRPRSPKSINRSAGTVMIGARTHLASID
jgi:hypothetical protein